MTTMMIMMVLANAILISPKFDIADKSSGHDYNFGEDHYMYFYAKYNPVCDEDKTMDERFKDVISHGEEA
jgi:hypothetical protein